MKVFADTNVFSEFVENRKYAKVVRELLHRAEDGDMEICFSEGSLYTLCYLTERSLKTNNVHRPALTRTMRIVLVRILHAAHLLHLTPTGAKDAVMNKDFTDIEDSLQYQCAVDNHCDCLVTINLKDFRMADQTSIKILSPMELYLTLKDKSTASTT